MAGKKLLVADDSLTIQKVIRLALSNEGYQIQTTSDGNDALQQLSVFRPDIVLIDVSLPGRSAFELKREVNESEDLRHIRFILMSSAFEKIDEAQAAATGFDGRLTKPFDPANLRQVLADVATSISNASIAPIPSGPSKDSFDMSLGDIPQAPDLDAEPTLSGTLPPSRSDETTLSGLPPLPSSDDIWSPNVPNIPPPAHPPGSAGSSSGSGEEDIRTLTESTIRMSGLDDFQWGMNEPGLKPFPSLSDSGESSFEIPGTAGIEDPFKSEVKAFPEDLPSPPPPPRMAPPGLGMGTGATAAQGMSPQIEEMIRLQVQEALEKMAKTVFPEVAEKVIKQEIHRLLSEQL